MKLEKLSKNKLKVAMVTACIGTSKLAQLAEVQPATISKFLKADSPIRLPTLGKISRALNVSPQDLILEGI